MANDYYASRLKEITGNRLAAGKPVAQSYAKPRERYVPPVIEAPQAPSVSKPETSILEDIGKYVGESPNLQKALNIIGGLGGAAITQATNWADQNLTAGDFGADVAKQFAQGTYEYAKENPLKSPLAPVLGGLANLGAQAKSGEDLTKALYALGARTRGVDEATSKRLAEYTAQQNPITTAVLGFGQELAIDPLNALTFGSGSVAKAGAKAAEKAAKAIAKTKNIKVPKGKVSKQLPEKVYEQTLNKYSGMETQLPVLRPTQQVAVPAQKVTADAERIARAAQKRGFSPEKARQLAQQATRQTQLPTETLGRIEQIAQANKIATQREIENAAKAARAASQNALISFDLPFTNITGTIVNKPKFLRKTADLAGAEGAAIVNGLFKVPQGLSDKAREKFLQSKQNFLMEQYGVTRAEDMTIEEVRDLQARFEKANIQEGKLFDLQTVYKPKIVSDVQRATVQQPFLLDEFLKDASPELKDIVQTKLRSGMTPEQVIAELPASLRDVAEKGKRQVVPADRVPIPNAIATKLDDIFNYQQQAGQSLDYQTEFAKMVDLYNDPTMDKAKFADAVDSLLASSKAEVDRMDQAKFARQTQTAQQIASENKRLKNEYESTQLAYKTAKANRALNKKQARTEAVDAREAEYARQVAEYEAKLADIEAQQTALAKQTEDAERAKAEADQAAERKARKQKQAKKLRAEQSANVSKVQAEKAPVEPEKVTEVVETYEPVKRYNNPPSAEAYRKINPTHIEEQIKVIDAKTGGKPRISYVFHDPELLTEPVAKALYGRINEQIRNFEVAFRGKNIPDEKAKELEFLKKNSEKSFTRLTELRKPAVKTKEPVVEQPKVETPVDENFVNTVNRNMNAKGEVSYLPFLKAVIERHRRLFPNHVEKVITDADGKKVHVFTRSAEESARIKKELVEKSKKDLREKRRKGQLQKKITKQVPAGFISAGVKQGKKLKTFAPKFDGSSKVPTNWVDMARYLSVKENLSVEEIYGFFDEKGYGRSIDTDYGSYIKFPDEKSASRADYWFSDHSNDEYVYGKVGDTVYQIKRAYPKQSFEEALKEFKIKPPTKPVAEPKKKVPVIEAVTPTKAEAPVVKAEAPKPTVVEKIAEDLAPKTKVKPQKPQPKRGEGLKFKAPEKPVQEAPDWAIKRAETTNGEIVYHDNDVALIRGYDASGDSVFGVINSEQYYSPHDIESKWFSENLVTRAQKEKLIAAKKKWIEADAKAYAENPNGPFKNGDNFASSPNVPKELQEIAKKWQSMLGINERIYLTTIDDTKSAKFAGPFAAIPSQGMNVLELGSKRRLRNGDFVIAYKSSAKTAQMLETISHEIGHALMDTRYVNASEEVRKAIDAEFEKWLADTKGKTGKELVTMLRGYTTGKNTTITAGSTADNMDPYWKSKSEWFADQVSRWATTNEKPMSVVEKFFSRLAKVMKQFFQTNKQYLASKTMEDWLNGLSDSAKNEQIPYKPTDVTESQSLIERLSQDMNVKTTVKGNNIKLQSGNVEIELPKKPKKKDIPLVIKQIEEAIKPEKPTYQAVPKVEPIKARTLPKAKRKELAELRKNLQPSGAPKVIEGLDKALIKEINTAAKKLEIQKPTKAVDIAEEVGVMDIGVNKVIRGEQPTRTRRIPFNKLREEGAFVRDAGGLGPLQKIIRDNKLFKMFNARSLGTGNRFIDQYGALIQDASTRISGESRFIRRDLVAIQKAAEGLRPDEMQAVQYVVENRFPSGKVMTEADKEAILANPKIKKVAELTRNLLGYLGKEDLASGVIKGLRADYFPHLLKFDLQKAEEFKAKYLNDPDLKDLAKGLSQTSGFAKERTGLPTLAEYDDLVAELIAKRDNATNAGQIQRLDEKISELTDLFNRDTVSVLNSRIYQSVRSRAMRDLYNQMKADGMIKYGEGFKAGFTQLSPKQAGLLGLDKRTAEGGVYIKDEILKGLEKVEGVFSDEKMNAFVQTMDDITRIWKLGTTVLIPKHYVNNLIGNAFNNGLAGVKTKSYQDAMSFLNKLRQNKLTPQEQKTALSLYRDGVIGQGINAEFRLTDDLPDRTILQRMSDWAQNTWYAKKVMHIGEAVDDWSRLALYLHSKEVSGSHKIATDAVRQFLFNYHETTRADRFMRSMMMPFWLWMKNNIPLQFQQVLRQPRYYLAAEKIRQATFEDDELQDQPDYIREKGFKLFGQNYVIGLPMYDLYMINGVQGTLKNVANMFGPIQTAIPELVFNKDVFTGAPISKELGRRGGPEDYTQDDITNYLARQFGGFLGGEYLDYKKNVIDKEILTSAEQIERSLKGVFLPKPQLERQ